MAGSSFAGPIAADRDPSLAFLNNARAAIAGVPRNGQRPLETSVLTMQATAGNAAVGQFLQRLAAGGAGGAGGTATDAPAKTYSVLRFGSQGDEVRQLQAMLNQANAAQPPLPVTGIYARRTQAAVRVFQRAHPPLAIDGDAGPATRPALEQVAPVTPATGADSAGGTEEVDPFEAGKAYYEAEEYGHAYDEFSKAYERDGDPALLYDRAQALRKLGGRREDAMALYEQFLKLNVPDAAKATAQRHLDELRGPARSTNEDENLDAVNRLHGKGAKLYAAGEYGKAYDEFTKAWHLTNDLAMLWNRAQALRLLGGRREEAIALYEQFISSGGPDEQKEVAKREIATLRGPGRSGNDTADESAVDILYEKGRKHFKDEEYPQAYDEFSKAYEVSREPELLYDRAQALRFQGGRRDEAIALFEQFLAANVAEQHKKAARAVLADLRGPGNPNGGAAASR